MDQKDILLNNIIEEIKMCSEHINYLIDLYELQKELTLTINNQNCLIGVKLIYSALYDASFISIAKLVSDNDKQTISINKLIKKINDNIYVFEPNAKDKLIEATNICKNKLENDYKDIIIKIKTRRDKLIVHNDKKYFTNLDSYEDSIPNYELWSVTSVIKEFICSVADILEIPVRVHGQYVECKDLRKIIDSNVFIS